jgi:hypothetical protein
MMERVLVGAVDDDLRRYHVARRGHAATLAARISKGDAGKQKLLRKRIYAYPSASFDPLVTLGGGTTHLTAEAFKAFDTHVKSFEGCAARRLKVCSGRYCSLRHKS